jgi:transposase-like protein
MGRKSALTEAQWIDVERRILVHGESVNSIAKEYGINEAAIRRKINPKPINPNEKNKSLISLAKESVEAKSKVREISKEIAKLPIGRQSIVSELERSLVAASNGMAMTAENCANVASKMAAYANAVSQKIEMDDIDGTMQHAKNSMMFLQMANEASKIPLNLLAANKDKAQEKPPAPSGLNAFYGSDD